MNQEPQNQEVNGKFHGFTSNTLQFVLRFVNFVFITGLRNILSRLFTILLYVVLNFLVVGPILPPSSGHAHGWTKSNVNNPDTAEIWFGLRFCFLRVLFIFYLYY